MENGYIVALAAVIAPILGAVTQATISALTQRWGLAKTQEEERRRAADSAKFKRLERARALVQQLHWREVQVMWNKERQPETDPNKEIIAVAAYSANIAELRGVTHAINDEKLTALVFAGLYSFTQVPIKECDHMIDEMIYRQQSQKIYTRIEQLLEKSAAGEKGE